MDNRINVALVDGDSAVLREFEYIFAAQNDIRLLGSFQTAGAVLQWLRTNEPDVLIVDLCLPDASGTMVIQRCKALYPDCSVMVFTGSDDENAPIQSFRAGARGYVLKQDRPTSMVRAVRVLREGGSPISPSVAHSMLSKLVTAVDDPSTPDTAKALPAHGLSSREAQVLELISRGYTYEKAAFTLDISKNTLQTHVKKIYGKLGVHSKIDAINIARQRGL